MACKSHQVTQKQESLGVKVITTVEEMIFLRNLYIQVMFGVHQYSYDKLSFPNFMKFVIDFSS